MMLVYVPLLLLSISISHIFYCFLQTNQSFEHFNGLINLTIREKLSLYSLLCLVGVGLLKKLINIREIDSAKNSINTRIYVFVFLVCTTKVINRKICIINMLNIKEKKRKFKFSKSSS